MGTSILIGALGGLVLGLIISFKATIAPYLGDSLRSSRGTRRGRLFGTAGAPLSRDRHPGRGSGSASWPYTLVAYSMRLIRVTQQFRAIVVGATGAIALLYVVTMVLGLFHVNVPVLNDSTPLGIIVSLVICGVAAMNLVLDSTR